jgi:hypothetical protein
MSGCDKVDVLSPINDIPQMKYMANAVISKIREKVVIIKPIEIFCKCRAITPCTPMSIGN